jgi:hypothetical protein
VLVLVNSKCLLSLYASTLLTIGSLAMVEMKYLLRGLYSRYRTRISSEMTGSMELYDQSISTRPRDQTCLLELEPIGKKQ